jgi:hypothetical protein
MNKQTPEEIAIIKAKVKAEQAKQKAKELRLEKKAKAFDKAKEQRIEKLLARLEKAKDAKFLAGAKKVSFIVTQKNWDSVIETLEGHGKNIADPKAKIGMGEVCHWADKVEPMLLGLMSAIKAGQKTAFEKMEAKEKRTVRRLTAGISQTKIKPAKFKAILLKQAKRINNIVEDIGEFKKYIS